MTREEFVTKVIALMESAPDSLARDMGEALVGMGVETLVLRGVKKSDIARSILKGDKHS